MARATSPSDKNRPRSPRGRWRSLVLRGLGAVLLLLAALYLFRGSLIAPRLVALGGAVLGGTLEVESVGGDWFGSLTLDGVRFEAEDPEAPATPLAGIEGGTLDARFSLWRLIRGDLGGLHELKVSADALALDVRPKDAESTSAKPKRSVTVPDSLPPLRLDVGDLNVLLPQDGRLAARDVGAETTANGARLLAATLTWDRPDAESLTTTLDLDATYRAGRIELEPFTPLAGVDVELLQADLAALFEGGPLLDVRGTAFDGSVELSLGRQDGGWSGEANVAGVELARVAERWPERTGANLAGALDFSGTFAADAEGAHASLQLGTEGLTDGKVAVQRAEARLELSPDLATLERLEIESSGNRMTADAIEIPLAALRERGRARLSDLLRAARGQAQLELSDPHALFGGRDEPATSTPAGTFDLSMEGGVVEIRSARIVGSAGRLSGGHGRFVLGPESQPWAGATVDVDYDVEIADLGLLGRIVGRPAWTGSLDGSLVLTGPLLAPQGRLEGVARNVLVGHWRLDEANVRAFTDGNRFEITNLEGRSGTTQLVLRGAWDRDTDLLEDVSLVVDSEDLRAVPELGAVARLSGALRLDVTATGSLAAPEGGFRLTGTELFGREDSTIDARGTFTRGYFVLESARIEEAGDHLDVSARLERAADGALAIEIDRIEALRAGSTLALAEPATVTVIGGGVRIPRLSLIDPTGENGNAEVEFTFERQTIAGSVTLERFDPTPLVFPWLPEGWSLGPVDADVALRREGETTEARASFAALDARPGAEEPAWALHLEAGLAQGRLTVTRCEAVREDEGELRLTGTAPLAPFADERLGEGPIELALSMDARGLDRWQRWLPALPITTAGDLHLETDLAGDWSGLTGNVRASGAGLELHPVTKPTSSGFEPPSARRTASLTGGTLELNVAIADTIRIETGRVSANELGTLELTGGIESALDPGALARGETRELLDAPLDARALLALEDVSRLPDFLRGVRRMEGALAGSVGVTGTLRNRDLIGELDLRDGGVRFDTSFPPIESMQGRVTLAGTKLDFESVRGEIGAGPVEVRGTLDFGAAGGTALDFTATGQDILLARATGMRIRADINLRLAGPLARLDTTGSVTLTDGYFGRDYDLFGFLSAADKPTAGSRGFSPSFFRRPPLSDMRLDVEIDSREPFVLRNNLVSGSARPALQVRGTGRVPLFMGAVYLDPTRLSLPSGTLALESGFVEFLEADPFMPRLRLTGEMRTNGYEIQVDVSGEYIEPEVVLSSNPPLPNDQLLLLFLTGELPQTAASDRSVQAAQSIASFLARDLIARRFTKDGEGSDMMQRFELEWGAEVSQSGNPTARLRFLLDDRPQGPGRVPYLAGEADRFDKINFGFGWLFRFR